MPGNRSGAATEAAPEISARIMTFRYVIALAILAMIAVASHVSFSRVLRADKVLYGAKSAGRNKVAELTGVEEPILLAEGTARAG